MCSGSSRTVTANTPSVVPARYPAFRCRSPAAREGGRGKTLMSYLLINLNNFYILSLQNFIVRGSSQSKTMAVSVRLPLDTGPYIEHYLIQSNEGLLSLESSRFKFDSIPALIAHYSQCCDELPVQLCLPKALREAKNRQQLSSLALLGQEFWRYPMASPKPKTVLSANSSHLNTPSDATQSSGIGLTFNNNRNLSSFNHFGPESNPNFAGPSETPTDTISTMSSFTIGQGHQLLSPESIDSAVIMSPSDPNQTGIIGKTSTFKSKRPLPSPTLVSCDVEKQIEIFNANLFGSTDSKIGESVNAGTLERQLKTPRPTPPNTLNIKPIRYGMVLFFLESMFTKLYFAEVLQRHQLGD